MGTVVRKGDGIRWVKVEGASAAGVDVADCKTELQSLAAARELIERCGYGRRREELADAEAALAQWRQRPAVGG